MSGSLPRFVSNSASVCSSTDSLLNQDSRSSKAREDCFSHKQDLHPLFRSPLLADAPLSLLCSALAASQSLPRGGRRSGKVRGQALDELEMAQAKGNSLCSTHASMNHSPLLGPSTLQPGARPQHQPLEAFHQTSAASIFVHSRKVKIDQKIQTKTWIQQIIRAIEEDLGKSATKCANKYCARVQEQGIKTEAMKRKVRGHKEWLCDVCLKAFDEGQFCEFCGQIYLDTKNEAALDGQEWAQCEAGKRCSRWTHVDCLARKFGITREMVVADNFKYSCYQCQLKVGGKRAERRDKESRGKRHRRVEV
eukprot:TRINITY_DN3911_c0_g1_i8.p2 TRINITY_DN3911_c0_g1~~TRINITY_DN3911_c0_g1_i8.p2  ORF type:complete len:307 (-),score=54.19 TRINITY_DN3911_c0_g1_i8:20-940(-)